MKILFVGDIVGNPGRKAVKKLVPELRTEMGIDFCIANGENAAGGIGITNSVANELYANGVDVITLGNHTWSKKSILTFIDSEKRLIRPANFYKDLPGKGSTVIDSTKASVGVLNLQGRTYMDNIDCPFRTAAKEIDYLKDFCNIIIVDFHAEATSEKIAFAWHFDGKVACIVGTHTHVQTADERILPEGTGYITDVGMTGPYDGIIGVDKRSVIKKFITNLPERFEVASGTVQFNAVLIDIDVKNKKTTNITRIMKLLDLKS